MGMVCPILEVTPLEFVREDPQECNSRSIFIGYCNLFTWVIILLYLQ
jgi:hypothetical protein